MSAKKKGPKRPLNVISLLLTVGVNDRNLGQVMQTAKNSGAAGFELTSHPALMKVSRRVLAKCANSIMPITALCEFFGDGDPDPLEEPDAAYRRMRRVIDLAAFLGDETGTTPVVTGPWGFKIEHPYDRRDVSGNEIRLIVGLSRAGEYADKKKVTLAHEVLQARECRAINGFAHHEYILNAVGMPGTVGEHHDTFHADLWGESSAEIIRRRPDTIHWFHASGSSRHSPGHASDHIPWLEIASAMDEAKMEVPICFEGFGREFREAVPAIGRGYPKDLPGPVAIAQAHHHLLWAGVIKA